jgi:hypothetical protein
MTVEVKTRNTPPIEGWADEHRLGLFRRLTSLVASRGARPRGRETSGGRQCVDDPSARLDYYLVNSDAMVLHHRRLPGRGRRISHLIVGPAGVTVVDSRHYGGRGVRVESGALRIGFRKRSDLIERVVGQVKAVRDVLADTPYADVAVEAALARRKVDGIPVIQQAGAPRVVVCGTRRIAGEASRPGPLSKRAVSALAAYLERELPPA